MEIGEFLTLVLGIPFLLGMIYLEVKYERDRKRHNRTGRR